MEYINEAKQRHMFGVAKYMAEHAEKYDLNPEQMYVLGLLHDIGFIDGQKDHADKGARILFELGYKDSKYISWHDTSPEDYKKSQLVEDIPRKLLLLYEADLSISWEGEEIGFDRRLADIKYHYGEESEEYETAVSTIEYLRSLEEDKE